MNAVVQLAIISSMNSGLYGSSRVLYTQAVDGRHSENLFAFIQEESICSRNINVYFRFILAVY